MPIDMKEIIADAVKTLLFEKKVKKLTVKDIVTECKITRQAFYYHFEDIPELLQWILEKESEKLVEACMKQENTEQGLSYFFTFAVSMNSHTKKGLQSNYGEEIDRLLKSFIFDFFKKAVENNDAYKEYSSKDKEFIVRYHCQAIIGILKDWNSADEKEMDYIVRQIYLILRGEVHPF